MRALLRTCTLVAALASGCYAWHDGDLVDAGSSDSGAPDAVVPPTDAACAEGAACDDGDPCTIDDRCRAGACAGTPRVCDSRQAPASRRSARARAASASTSPPTDRATTAIPAHVFFPGGTFPAFEVHHAWFDASGEWVDELVPAPFVRDTPWITAEAAPDGMLHVVFPTYEHALVHAQRRFCP
ncbi:MAG TPA: hypothetical protein VIL20_02550 [Sandaracinaceae bacterium]